MNIPQGIPSGIGDVLTRVQKTLSTNPHVVESENIQMKNSKQQDLSKCPLCNGIGLIQNSETGAYYTCNCEKEAGLIRALSKTGLSKEALKKSFKEFSTWNEEVKAMKNIASNYFLRFENIKNTDDNSLALLGESGSGKTHLLVALINNFVSQKHIDITYMSYIDSITELKQSVLDREIYQKKMIRYKETQILVIDDLFKGGYTDSDIRIMLEVINHRYINKLPFMVSSEYILSDITKIDKALGGRIAERTKGYIYQIKGIQNNYRLKMNKKSL